LKNKVSSISLVALCLAGCGTKEPVEVNTASKTPTTKVPVGGKPSGAAESGSKTPEVASPGAASDPSVNPSTKGFIPNGSKEMNSKPEVPPIAEAQTQGWVAKPSKAEMTLAKLDASIKGLKNAKFMISTDAQLPQGRGFTNTECVIADQKDRYLLRYAYWFENGNMPYFENDTVAKIDGKIQTFRKGKYRIGRFEPKNDILNLWATDHSHYISHAIGTSLNPFAMLGKKAIAAGWKLTEEEKAFETGRFTRIVLRSTKEPARKIEIMVDPGRLIPVSVQVEVPGKKPIKVKSLVSWAFSSEPLKDEDISPFIKTAPIQEIDKIKRSGGSPQNKGT
jgi:predicted small lipoprotein YifL